MTAATKTYRIPEWLRLGVPGSCQGQTIECSYGIDLQSGVAVCRSFDRSDRTTSWAIADLTDEEMDALEHYDAGGASYPPSVEADYVTVDVIDQRE
jgi:hypothetical protein